jgi:hypothetical protein
MIAGIAETPTALLGMQYSPSPGGVDQIGAGGSITQGGRLQGVTQTAFLSLFVAMKMGDRQGGPSRTGGRGRISEAIRN